MFLMIDNYDSFTYNLYALFRECNADVKIIRNDEYIPADEYDGIIISPGPSNPEHSGTSLKYLENYMGKKPVFGVCLGMQCIAHALGYNVGHAKTVKHGKIDNLSVRGNSVLFRNLPENFDVVRYHSLAVEIDDALITSRSLDDDVIMSLEDRERQLFGVQFHPESILSEYGREIVNNFLDFIGYRGKKMKNIVSSINGGQTLGYNEAVDFFQMMVDGSLTEAQIASTLISMNRRGETVDELAGLISVLNSHKKKFTRNSEKCVDTCGTGGDGKSTVNVSTAVSIILASLGYKIVKHGNTAQSGKVGSADILKSIGLDLNYEGTSPEEFYRENNYVFLFAQHYHPALKGIGKVRREIMSPTIFNFVGPLVNPADPENQIIGISKKEKLEFISDAVMKLGKDNITVYASRDGYDEVSSSDKTDCIGIKNGAMNKFTIDPADYFTPFPMPEVKNADDALKMFNDGISGKDEKIANIFSLNAALALNNIEEMEIGEGFQKIKEHIMSGSVEKKMKEMFGREENQVEHVS
jgi:anthranilate phosphoribosyltransferase